MNLFAGDTTTTSDTDTSCADIYAGLIVNQADSQITRVRISEIVNVGGEQGQPHIWHSCSMKYRLSEMGGGGLGVGGEQTQTKPMRTQKAHANAHVHKLSKLYKCCNLVSVSAISSVDVCRNGG